MEKEFKLPELGENIESAKVASVLVKEGDLIKKDQILIEIETDKATIEVPSGIEGKVKKIFAANGEEVKVGQVIIVCEQEEAETEKKEEVKKAGVESAETNVPLPEKDITPPAGQESIVEMRLPELGENITEALVSSVLIKPGDILEKDQVVLEIETDKATIEVPSVISGIVKEVLAKQGEKVKVGDVIIRAVSSAAGGEKSLPKAVQTPPAVEVKAALAPVVEEVPAKGEKVQQESGEIDKQPPITSGSAPAAPSVRRIAREIGVDINEVPGSGPGGRISMDDVKAYSKKLHQQKGTQTGSAVLSAGIKKESLPDFSKFGEIDVQPMNNIRAKTADHLSYAWSVIPHVTQFDKADITELEEVRKKINSRRGKQETGITITTILVKVIEAALKKFPQFNSSIDLDKHEVIYKKYYNIGIAVDTEFGLIVPAVKNVERKNLSELAAEINTLAEKARSKKIGLEDLQGANFTITNLGGIGGTSFTPIINSPEVAILGVSRGSVEPVYKDSSFVPRLMLPLSLSYDHRIIDGADGIRFLRFICEILEEPLRIIL
jgi:pyruvate dehydrogenase E2 component (dihydrolipoamide acetyltransferase)